MTRLSLSVSGAVRGLFVLAVNGSDVNPKIYHGKEREFDRHVLYLYIEVYL